jgi:hypothetical protein
VTADFFVHHVPDVHMVVLMYLSVSHDAFKKLSSGVVINDLSVMYHEVVHVLRSILISGGYSFPRNLFIEYVVLTSGIGLRLLRSRTVAMILLLSQIVSAELGMEMHVATNPNSFMRLRVL